MPTLHDDPKLPPGRRRSAKRAAAPAHSRRARLRRLLCLDESPDDYQGHNRGPSAVLASLSVLSAIAAIICCAILRHFHWGGLVGVNLAVLLALAALTLNRSRLAWAVLAFVLIAGGLCFACAVLGKPGA